MKYLYIIFCFVTIGFKVNSAETAAELTERVIEDLIKIRPSKNKKDVSIKFVNNTDYYMIVTRRMDLSMKSIHAGQEYILFPPDYDSYIGYYMQVIVSTSKYAKDEKFECRINNLEVLRGPKGKWSKICTKMEPDEI